MDMQEGYGETLPAPSEILPETVAHVTDHDEHMADSGNVPADEFRRRLKELLDQRGMSARAASLAAGQSAGWLKAILSGRARAVRFDNAVKLARVLRVPVHALTGENHGADTTAEPVVDNQRGDHALMIEDAGGRMTAVVEILRPRTTDLASAEPRARWVMPADLFSHITEARGGEVVIFTNAGDAMEPTVAPGARLLVDLTDRTPSPPGLFVFHDGLAHRVMRAEYLPGTSPARVRFIPANPAYSSFEMDLAEANIQGRVIGRWQAS